MERARNISKSMISYLKRAREHKEFLLKETQEFERGKRHLANMMGIESGEMTQQDIDNAISYLFPSGLFDKRARPMMKHPDLLYKAQKDAQFDIEGRPHHYLFYTVKANYYEALSTLTKTLRELNEYEDEQLANGVLNPPQEARYSASGRNWLNHVEMCDKFIETISESEYEYLMRTVEHLTDHPYSARAQDLIEQFSKQMPGQSLDLKLPQLKKDEETGEIYTDMTVKKFQLLMRVKTVLNGTGKFELDDHDILFFEHPYFRRCIYFPMQLSGMKDKIDIVATIVQRPRVLGLLSPAITIQNAVSKSIAAYLGPKIRERLRLAGLLTNDPRTRERKKFGQEGARRKYTWKKR